MDAPTRLKMKIGDHEFDAEGSAESVREQFQAWQELVKMAATVPATRKEEPSGENQQGPPLKPEVTTAVDSALTKIMRVENRTVSLTAQLTSVHDALLVMIYGQKTLRNNDAVTGAELIAGISATGGFSIGRLDRILDKLSLDGDVTTFGERRGKKYRLTNTGIAKARAIASDMIAKVA
ncbi:MAG: hypothetical protein WAQ52_05220 [Terriglobales bacterium]